MKADLRSREKQMDEIQLQVQATLGEHQRKVGMLHASVCMLQATLDEH